MTIAPRNVAYGNLAGHYDDQGWDWYAATYGPRLLDLLGRRGLAAGRALDAGCGTGTLALAMAARGWKVTGLDLSDAMLEVARGKDASGLVAWRRGDITTFELGRHEPGAGPFDLITCVADTLNHLETLDEWVAAFGRCAAHQPSGGHLFFDVMTCRGLQRLDKISVTDLDDRTLVLSVVYEPAARRSTVKAISFVPADAAAGERSGSRYHKAVDT